MHAPAGQRLPCLSNGTIDVMRVFRVSFTESARTVLRDTDLSTFLRSARNLPTPAFFDFTAMSCPFDVRLAYTQPFWRNQVQQLDNVDPARAPLLDWLAEVTLDLDERQQLTVLGETLIVHVPCGRLDL